MFPPREEMLLPTLRAHAGSILILPFRIDYRQVNMALYLDVQVQDGCDYTVGFHRHSFTRVCGSNSQPSRLGGGRRAPLYLPEVMEKSQKEKKTALRPRIGLKVKEEAGE